MPLSDRFLVTKVEIWPVDIPITDPFVVATGQLVTAQNLFIRITLKDGSCGYGEVAPFPDVTSPCQMASLEGKICNQEKVHLLNNATFRSFPCHQG